MDPVLCPTCDEHFRGVNWPSLTAHVPWTLTCSHTLCAACADAVELAQTDTNDAVCPVCSRQVVPGTKVQNRLLADYAETVFRSNNWHVDEDHADEDEVPLLPPVTIDDPETQARVAALRQRCLYAANKMEQARDRAIAAKERLKKRLDDSLVLFDMRTDALRAQIIAHRDSNIAEAQRLVAERTAILQAQAAEMQATADRAAKLNEAVCLCVCAAGTA